jgi:hypothetical protein
MGGGGGYRAPALHCWVWSALFARLFARYTVQKWLKALEGVEGGGEGTVQLGNLVIGESEEQNLDPSATLGMTVSDGGLFHQSIRCVILRSIATEGSMYSPHSTPPKANKTQIPRLRSG